MSQDAERQSSAARRQYACIERRRFSARPLERLYRYSVLFWGDTHHSWQVSVSQSRTCARGLRILSGKHVDAYEPTFESAGALGLRRILRVCLARLPILPSLAQARMPLPSL
jgi:hypothetical protein